MVTGELRSRVVDGDPSLSRGVAAGGGLTADPKKPPPARRVAAFGTG